MNTSRHEGFGSGKEICTGKKAILTLVLALVLIASVGFFIGVSGESDADPNDDSGSCGDGVTYTYTADSKTLAIAKTGSGSGTMDDYLSGGAPWYPYRLDIQTLTIGSGVTSIGDYAFYGCSGITSLEIGESVTSIGNYAFYGCSGITGLTIPNSVKSIEEYAFQNCSGLTSFTIGESVTSIEDFAFYDCSELTTINIPKKLTTIGDGLFANCTKLTSITVSDGNTKYESVDGVLFHKEGDSNKKLIQYPNGKVVANDTYTIPDGVIAIGDFAFYGCSSLNNVNIPVATTSIEERAFANCTELTSITVSDGNTKFKSEDGVLFLKEGASIKKLIQYPNGKVVANDTYTIPEGVTEIGGFAFAYCSTLKEVIIPVAITSIGERAFANCTELTSITVSDGNTKYESVDGVLFLKEGDSSKKLIQYPNGMSAKEYIIPGNATGIEAFAFAYSSSLEKVTIPESVKTIDNNAFENCVNLKEVIIEGSIEDPAEGEGHSVFKGCTSLVPGDILYHFGSYIRNYMFVGCGFSSVQIPASITKIGKEALRNPDLTVGFDSGGWTADVDSNAFMTDVFMNGDERIDFKDANHRYFRGETYIYQDDAYRQIGTVEFDVQGHGIAPEKQWVAILGYKVSKPEDPSAAGFVFEGWFKESECINKWYFDIDRTTEKHTIIYAKWDVVKYHVTYDADGGSVDAPTQEDLAEGDMFEVAAYSGTKSGYRFEGWVCNGQTYQPGDQVIMGTSDMAFKAKWVIPIKYTVSVSAGVGGTVSKDSVTVDSGTMITSANNMLRIGSDTVIATPNDGFEFKFWSGVTSSTVTSNMNVTAIFSKEGELSWAISYSLEKGSWKGGYTAPTQYAEGVGTPLPSSSDIVPYKKDGYTVSFLGWYLTGDKSKTIVSSVTPTDSGDKSFTALWEETVNSYAYTVNYRDAAGKDVAPSYEGTAEFGTKVTPEIISVPGYVPPKDTKTITISSDESKNTITYVYAVITFTITISSGDHGTITGPSTVEYGSDAIIAITGDDDYIISDVTVDGESVGKKGVYTFASVTSDHTISATFEYKKDAETVIDDVGNVIEMYTEEQDGKDVRVAIHYNANGKTESYASVSVSEDINSVVSVITDSHGKTVVDTTAMISSDTGATITLSDLNNVKEAASSAAKSLDVDANDKMSIIVDSTTEAGTSKGASISFEGVSSDNTLAITVLGDAGSISFDSKVIADVLKTASAFNVVFEEADDSSITPEQRRAAGNNTVYDIFAVVNGKTMTTFDGDVKISMPYELKEGESATSVKIYYVNDEGNVELIGGNWSNGYVTSKLSHFSDYFAAADYELRNVTLEQTGEGSVEASTYSCSPGTTVKLTATPAGGWKLAKWESQQVTVNDGSFVMPDEDVTVMAVFEKASGSSSGFDWWWIPIIIVAIACIAGGFWFYNSRKA